MGERHLVIGGNIPKAGKGTGQMFARTGRNLSLPETTDGLEGPTAALFKEGRQRQLDRKGEQRHILPRSRMKGKFHIFIEIN